MKWLAKKKQQFVESMVTDAVGALQNHTQKIVSDGKKKSATCLQTMSNVLPIIFLLLNFVDVSSPKSVAQSQVSLNIETVNITINKGGN